MLNWLITRSAERVASLIQPTANDQKSVTAAGTDSAASGDLTDLILAFHAIHFLLNRAPPPHALAGSFFNAGPNTGLDTSASHTPTPKPEAAANQLIVDLVVRIALPLLASRFVSIHHFVRTALISVTCQHTSVIGLLVTDVCLHALRAAVPVSAQPSSDALGVASPRAAKAVSVGSGSGSGSGGGGDGISVDADMRVVSQLSVDVLTAPKLDSTLQTAFYTALFDAAIAVLRDANSNSIARRYVISIVLPAFCLPQPIASGAGVRLLPAQTHRAQHASECVEAVYSYIEETWSALPASARELALPTAFTSAISQSASQRSGTAPPAPAVSATTKPPTAIDDRRLGELYGLVCQYYHALHALQPRSKIAGGSFDRLVQSMALVGLESEIGLIAKQSAYLVRLRMQPASTGSSGGGTSASAVGDMKSPPALLTASHPHSPDTAKSSAQSEAVPNYSVEQWEAFLTLYEAMNEHARHLIQSVWPKINLLIPVIGMDEWLLLIFRRGFGHSNNTVKYARSVSLSVSSGLYRLGWWAVVLLENI